MTEDSMLAIISSFEARRGFTLNLGETFAFIAGYETAIADTHPKDGGKMKPIELAEPTTKGENDVVI